MNNLEDIRREELKSEIANEVKKCGIPELQEALTFIRGVNVGKMISNNSK